MWNRNRWNGVNPNSAPIEYFRVLFFFFTKELLFPLPNFLGCQLVRLSLQPGLFILFKCACLCACVWYVLHSYMYMRVTVGALNNLRLRWSPSTCLKQLLLDVVHFQLASLEALKIPSGIPARLLTVRATRWQMLTTTTGIYILPYIYGDRVSM